MAITQATVRNDQLELQRRGFINVNLTALTTTAVPDVEVGSAFEIGGSIYEIDTADETPAGWAGIANDTQAYIYFDASAETLNFTDTAPSYSAAKGGWYSGDDRYLARVYKDASGNADDKQVYAQHNETPLYFQSNLAVNADLPMTRNDALTSGSGNWIVPEGVYRVKAIVTGGGGHGTGEGGSPDDVGGDTTFSSLTGGGGKPGNGGFFAIGGTGGNATGGDINITGGDGQTGRYQDGADGGAGSGGASYWGSGGRSGTDNTVGQNGQAYGSGGGAADARYGSGGAGGTAIAILSVNPGDSIAYSVGSGAEAGTGSNADAGNGAGGVIYLEY